MSKNTDIETIKRNQAGATCYEHNAKCSRCNSYYDKNAYKEGLCGACKRIAETRKKKMTDGERDCVEFMSRGYGWRITH